MYIAGKFKESRAGHRAVAFTLIELLVVMAIIGILAVIGMPALKGLMGSTNAASAHRQLVDDLSYARLKAINDRTTVYVVFNSPEILNVPWSAQEKLEVEKRLNGQYTSYALFARRRLGDQPGGDPNSYVYITDWKSLPDGTYIATNKFELLTKNEWAAVSNSTNRPFAYFPNIPFPTEKGRPISLPCIAFDYQGKLVFPDGFAHGGDERIGISSGSIIYPVDDETGRYLFQPAEVIETPRSGWTNNPIINVDWLTGRSENLERDAGPNSL